jgi:uncharacterized membrane protein
MQTIWGLTIVDLAAFVLFLIAWIGYVPFLRWRHSRFGKVAAVMVEHRRAWMYSVLGREMRTADTAIMGHIMSTAGFFASTTVAVIAALLGTLINIARGTPVTPGEWYMIAPRDPLEVKLTVILVVALYAFFSFTWSIRQANFGAVMIGAAPNPPVAPEIRARLAKDMGNIITQVAAAYDGGMRSYYFAFAVVTWIASPILFVLATIAVVALLLYRQSTARTALSLQEIAAARDAVKNTTKAGERAEKRRSRAAT